MSYRRMDFRADKFPRKMKNYFISWGLGPPKRVHMSPRASSSHRRDYKNSHKTRQRQYNARVIDRGLLDWGDTPCV